jgi:hypothetical protein
MLSRPEVDDLLEWGVVRRRAVAALEPRGTGSSRLGRAGQVAHRRREPQQPREERRVVAPRTLRRRLRGEALGEDQTDDQQP